MERITQKYKVDYLFVFICVVLLISGIYSHVPKLGGAGNIGIEEPRIDVGITEDVADEVQYVEPTDCVKELAESFIGVREQGCNNCGAEVEQFWLRFIPTAKGARYAWCTFFTNFVLDSCGIDNGRNGWTPSLSNHKNATIIYQRGKGEHVNYEPNLVMTLYYANLKREGHSGLVVGVTGQSYVTVEGNTTMGGTRETKKGKDGVKKLYRPKSSVYRIIKYGK